MINKLLLAIFLTLSVISLPAQSGTMHYSLQLLAGYTGPDNVSFWIRSNQYGSVPPVGASLGLIGAVRKDYDQSKVRLTDWGFAAEGRLNVGKPTDFLLIEGYGKFRLSIFELKAGRERETTGLCDTVLSSGSWSVSGNALGVPKVQLAIPEFYAIPILGKLFAFKGSYMHGWIGNWYINNEAIPNTPTYLHQMTFYGRFGKPDWKLKLYGGFNHQVVWGNEDNIMGEDYELNSFQTYMYVISGKAYNNNSIQQTRIGNHLGSIDLGLEYNFKNMRLLVYRQNIYDAGALYYFANILDGLNGLSLVNKHDNGRRFQWKRISVEFLYTRNQAGETWSRYTPSPYENYYNNGYYKIGWSYKGLGMGNPFITPTTELQEELTVSPDQFFSNNRVAAGHIGMEGYLYGLNFTGKFSYSRNYGTYLTSPTGKIYEDGVNPSTEIFPETNQLSGFLQIRKDLKKGIQVGLTTAIDVGGLYNDSFGIIGSVSKAF